MKTKHVRMYKSTRRNLLFMLLTIAALVSGLLFYCVISEAADYETEELYLLPEAGFNEFLDEIEPIEPEPLLYIEPTYILSDEDADLLLRIGVQEAGCDGVDGIANVMQVVLNRVESDCFPDTVEDVIFQAGQFCSVSMLASANITPEAYVALDAVIFGEYQENDTHFFESCEGYAFSGWADYSFTYGGHDFYRVKER